MASINELINLSQYISGDVGREGLNGPRTKSKTPQEQQEDILRLKAMAIDISRKEQEAAIARRQREFWDSVGTVQGRNKTESGVTTAVVDDEEAGGRDIVTVGDYESPGYELENSDGSANRYDSKITASGRMVLALPKKPQENKPVDRVKSFNHAKKLAEQELIMQGIRPSEVSASEFKDIIKKYMTQEDKNFYEKQVPEVKKNVNPSGKTFSPEDFKDEFREKRGMIEVAKDFYFGSKKQPKEEGKVMIVTPDGKRGYIPKVNLKKAIDRGAKLVQ